MISVVLVESETAGNVGAVARLMLNFGVEKLVLVRPKCDHLSKECLDRAKHAKHLVQKAVVFDKEGLPEFDYSVATTAQLGKDYHILRSPNTPEELGELVKDKKANIALVFGPEGQGLNNEQVSQCDFLVTIPTSKENPVLNLSHSVAILLYEIFRHEKEHVSSHIKPIEKKHKDQIFVMLEEVLQKLPFQIEEKRETQRRMWKHILGRAMLTSREASSLMGFFSRILSKK
jgi:TrmH family RNA methyltransferase